MKRSIIIFFIGIFLYSSIYAQEDRDFHMNLRRETLLLGVGASLFVVGGYLCLKMNSPDPAHLHRNDILCIDRFAVDLSDSKTELVSDITSGLDLALPIVLSLSSRNRQIIVQDIIMYSESVFFMEGLAWLSKAAFERPRPYAYRKAESQNGSLGRNAARSFFSAHTAAAFNGAVYAGTVFQRRYPDSPWVKPIWIVGITAATATAVFRVTSGNHFPTDVLAGAVVGSFTGWLIPRLHMSKHREKGVSLIMGKGIGLRLYL